MAETTLDEFGRIVIPKRIRSRLGLQRGSTLSIDESGEGILLRPAGLEPPLKLVGGVLVFCGRATGEVEDAVRGQRDERIRSLGPRPRR